MNFLRIVSFIFTLSVTYIKINGFENPYYLGNEQISGYHFHTYFFQNNAKSILEAETLRDKIEALIEQDYFYSCLNSRIYREPAALHPLGNFITCCNATSMWRALPWFMHNHGNLSVLLHPLTKMAFSDHTERALFLGKIVPLDFTQVPVPNDLKTVFKCVDDDLPQRQGVPQWV